jgi:hypothetical protein
MVIPGISFGKALSLGHHRWDLPTAGIPKSAPISYFKTYFPVISTY